MPAAHVALDVSSRVRRLTPEQSAEARRAELRDVLLRLTPSILAAESEPALLEALARDLRLLVECERSMAVYLLERAPEGERLTLVYADGIVAAALRAAGPRPLCGALGRAATTAAPYVVSGGDDPVAERVPGAPDRPGAAMAVPLVGRAGAIGAVMLTSYRPAPYRAEEAEVALLFCNHAALALENLRLSRQASEAAALRRLDELKDELMRTVSHELRTPLSYIYGYAELLTASPGLPERERSMAQEIYRSADHMRRIVDDLLELGRLDARQARIEPEPLAVGDAIAQAVAEVQRVEAGNAHRYVVQIDNGLPPAHADPVRLKQVLANLLTNAARYSPAGSEVLITARAVPSHGEEGAAIEIAVTDQGAGLTAEQRERIFEPFYRGNVDLTGKHPGAGLGLAISRGLVEAQGGRIWAESGGPGAGAVFRFTLPLADDEAMPVDGNPAAAG